MHLLGFRAPKFPTNEVPASVLPLRQELGNLASLLAQTLGQRCTTFAESPSFSGSCRPHQESYHSHRSVEYPLRKFVSAEACHTIHKTHLAISPLELSSGSDISDKAQTQVSLFCCPETPLCPLWLAQGLPCLPGAQLLDFGSLWPKVVFWSVFASWNMFTTPFSLLFS